MQRLLFHTRNGFNLNTNKEFLESAKANGTNNGFAHKTMSELDEFYRLSDEFNLNEEQLNLLIRRNAVDVLKQKKEYEKKPIVERKDNKGSINYGNRSGHPNPIRYPSKKRSRATWKRFYTLFPHLAEKDEWNGKSSKRMK
jgi:hypothetical protein